MCLPGPSSSGWGRGCRRAPDARRNERWPERAPPRLLVLTLAAEFFCAVLLWPLKGLGVNRPLPEFFRAHSAAHPRLCTRELPVCTVHRVCTDKVCTDQSGFVQKEYTVQRHRRNIGHHWPPAALTAKCCFTSPTARRCGHAYLHASERVPHRHPTIWPPHKQRQARPVPPPYLPRPFPLLTPADAPLC